MDTIKIRQKDAVKLAAELERLKGKSKTFAAEYPLLSEIRQTVDVMIGKLAKDRTEAEPDKKSGEE